MAHATTMTKHQTRTLKNDSCTYPNRGLQAPDEFRRALGMRVALFIERLPASVAPLFRFCNRKVQGASEFAVRGIGEGVPAVHGNKQIRTDATEITARPAAKKGEC